MARKAKDDGNRPQFTFKMKAKDPRNKASSIIGSAWQNDNGSIGIVLRPGAVLNHRDCQDYFLTLWPNDD